MREVGNVPHNDVETGSRLLSVSTIRGVEDFQYQLQAIEFAPLRIIDVQSQRLSESRSFQANKFQKAAPPPPYQRFADLSSPRIVNSWESNFKYVYLH
jgi:hypothetical protein